MSNRPPEDTAVSVKTGQFIVSRLTPSQPGALGIVGIYGDRACPILNAYFHAFKGPQYPIRSYFFLTLDKIVI